MKHLITAVISMLAFAVQAQLPKGLTLHEKSILETYFENLHHQHRAGITAPPKGSNLRTAAEWEEVQALVITWTNQFNGIQTQIVDAAQEECLVIITCSDSNAVKNTLQNNGVPLTNLSFLETGFNSIWIRDYGGNTVYTAGVDSLVLVDWIYNRPRPSDDVMPQAHANLLNIPLYKTTASPTDLVNTGGNWMSDGQGTAFASELILEENEPMNPYAVTPKSEAEVDAIVSDFMGIDRYIKMPTLPYDGIHHIDMHMKLLDEETILVSEYPDGVADGPQIEANMEYVVSNYTSYFGTPYQLKWITVPPSVGGFYPDNNGYYRTYSNMIFVNKTILLPTYRTEYDTTAIRTLQEAMPGYNIVGIDVDDAGENLISLGGAIHCITHTIGVEDPLLIVHQPLKDQFSNISGYTISAEVAHRSGIASAQLFYRLKGESTYQSISMNSTSGGLWQASIPAQAQGAIVEYYVQATANNGKTLSRPIVAPDGYWSFEVLGPNGLSNSTADVAIARVFPNPASAITCIEVNTLQPTNAEVVLYDALGRTVEVLYDGYLSHGENKFFFNAATYEKGIYMIVLKTDTGKQHWKLAIH